MYVTCQSFESDEKDELNFRAGQKLEILKKTLDGWWFARYAIKQSLPFVSARADARKSSPA